MLPPDVDCIADELISRFRIFLEHDSSAVELPHLLAAEEEAVELSQRIGLGMIQSFVEVRAEQAKVEFRPTVFSK